MNKVLFFVIVFSALLSCKTSQTNISDDLYGSFRPTDNQNPFYSDKNGVFARNGMVASAHPEASEVGKEILRKGGNAVDASIATFFALAVVYPTAGNIGGGGFAIVRDANANNYALDFREKAPLKAHKDMYLDEYGNVIQGKSLLGHLASGVPGSVSGMVDLHKELGKMSWQKLLEPAIELAEYGVILTAGQARTMNASKSSFQLINGKNSPYFIKPNGLEWKEGDLFIQKDLGATLKRIQKNKKDGFYGGLTADLISKEMEKGGGIISKTDLEEYNSVWRTPIKKSYKNYQIISMPPPSSGGIALVQLLRLLEDYPLKDWGWNSERTVQAMVEAERRVYADRATWLGDEDFVKIPSTELMSYPYLAERWSDFDENKATDSREIEGGEVPFYESEETTHFSVVDKSGMAVSITTTLNGGFGSKVVVDGAGFLMNNEMDDFSLKAGVPNMFGLIGNKANEIQPGKRMLSSMTPTIVEKEGELMMVLGTPGGSRIITSVYQTLLNVVEHGMNMQQAVNARKFHHQWLPDKVFLEKDAIDLNVLQSLLGKGYIVELETRTIGRMDCILVHPNGILEGASDPRGENTSIGY